MHMHLLGTRETERDSRGVARAAIRRCMCPSVANAAEIVNSKRSPGRKRTLQIPTPRPHATSRRWPMRAHAYVHASCRSHTPPLTAHPFPRGPCMHMDMSIRSLAGHACICIHVCASVPAGKALGWTTRGAPLWMHVDCGRSTLRGVHRVHSTFGGLSLVWVG